MSKLEADEPAAAGEVESVFGGFGDRSPPPCPPKASTPAGSTWPPPPGIAWRIRSGFFDLFAQTVDPATGEEGRPRHVLRVGTGAVMVGMQGLVARGSIRLAAVGSLETEKAIVPLIDLLREPDAAVALDAWCRAIATLLPAASGPADRTIRAGDVVDVTGDETIEGAADPLWIAECSRDGAAPSVYVPLPPHHRLRLGRACAIEGLTTAVAIARDVDRFVGALDDLDAACCDALAHSMAEEAERQGRRLGARRRADQERFTTALRQLGSVLDPDPDAGAKQTGPRGSEDPCRAAVERVLSIFGEDGRTVPPMPPVPDESAIDYVERLATACRLRGRRVLLTGSWWHHDRGVLIGFGIDGAQTPAVLRPSRSRGYDVLRTDGQATRVTGRMAEHIRVDAIQFYRSFAAGPVGLKQMLDLSRDVFVANGVTLLSMAALTGLLALAPPLAIAFLFDMVLPHAERGTLFDVAIGVGVVAIGIACFDLTKAIALIRLESGISLTFQAAVIDRLLALPVRFFAGYASGDLADRMLGITEIRRTLASHGTVLFIELLFSGFSLALLFLLSPPLAVLASTLLLVTFVLAAALNLGALRYETAALAERGKLDGFTVQLALGIGKLRVAAAERRAMSAWMQGFTRQQRQLRHGQSYRVGIQVMAAALPTVGLIVLFAGSTLIGTEAGRNALTAGSFMAFNAAFGALMGVMLAVSTQSIEILRSVPLYMRARPLLHATAEPTPADDKTVALTGKITLHDLHFRYAEKGPEILDGLSLEIRSGEYLAVVGPSGSGKSTLLRLLLGFETPRSGAIFFDGVSQDQLDLTMLRRSMGIVLQQNRINPGNLFQNIVGSSGLGLDDAWHAARLAGLAEDIEALPMGMHTTMMEGGQGLSGGQRQRLLIARALVHRPRIVLFDEATSALDNRTQDIVTNTVAGLRATRIVIAHRLSTIERADRIAVLDRGRLVQLGGFAELKGTAGPFLDLAQRQLL